MFHGWSTMDITNNTPTYHHHKQTTCGTASTGHHITANMGIENTTLDDDLINLVLRCKSVPLRHPPRHILIHSSCWQGAHSCPVNMPQLSIHRENLQKKDLVISVLLT